MKNKKVILLLVSLTMLILALLIKIFVFTDEKSNLKINNSSYNEELDDFDLYLETLFNDYISSSPLEMSLLISSPADYGLEHLSSKLDNYSDEALMKSYDETQEALKQLRSFNRSTLDEDQQLTYDILEYYLSIQMEGKPFYQHAYNIQHTLGFHIGLPLTLTQVPIETKQDAEDFIQRLEQFPTAFNQMLEGEKVKAEKGLLPPEYILDKVIEQSIAFMTQPEKNMLYLAFSDYIDNINDINDNEKTILKTKCLEIIENSVYPSYEHLINVLEEIKSNTVVTTGVWELPKGKEYYSYLVKVHTGTKLTPEELLVWANDTLVTTVEAIDKIYTNNPEILETNLNSNTYSSFENLYDKCLTIAQDNFYDYNIPKINRKTIPSYLEKDLPAAFYLPVSIDMKKYGNMFVKNSLNENLNEESFVIISHEGIPGHHFQFSIAHQLDIPNIRKILNFTCFSEGWASYIEGIVYNYIDYGNPAINELMIYNSDATYALLTLVDLAIHYYEMDRAEVIEKYRPFFGLQVDSVVDRAIANPGETLHYAYGRYVMNNLRDLAMERLGDEFNIKEFHDVILTNGELPLFILEEIVNDYIENKLDQ